MDTEAAETTLSAPSVYEISGDCMPHQQPTSSSQSSSCSEYAKLLSFIYAILLTIVGFLLSISEAVTNNWLGSIPNAVFFTYQLVIGTAYLVLLQFYLLVDPHLQQTPPTSPRLSWITERLSRIRQLVRLRLHGTWPPSDNRSSHSNTNDVAMNVNDVNSSCDDVSNSPRSQSSEDDKQGTTVSLSSGTTSHIIAFVSSQGTTASNSNHQHGFESASPYLTRRNTRSAARCQHVSESSRDTFESSIGGEEATGDDGSMFWMDLDKLGNLFSHQGSRLYMRVGALAFGLGNVIYTSLEVETWLHPDEQCAMLRYDFGWIFILRLLFIVVQTFVMFKGTQVMIVNFQLLSYFGFMHLISTNLCLWLNTLIREIIGVLNSISFTDGDRDLPANTSLTTTVSHNSSGLIDPCKDSAMLKVSRYLFPFVLEYSLLAIGAVACALRVGIGPKQSNRDHEQLTRGFKNLIRVRSYKRRLGQNNNNNNIRYNNNNNNNNDIGIAPHSSSQSMLAKSHSGVFIGTLLLAGVITCVVLFYFEIGVTNEKRSTQIYLVTDVILHGCLLIACIMAMILTRNLGYVPRPLSTDDFLLVLTMSGSLLYETAVIVAAANHFLLHSNAAIGLDMAASILAASQTVLQTILILSGMRRYPSASNDVISMPGRGTFSFLIIGNVAVWIQRTMEVKELTSFDRVHFYGSIVWLLLININLPLLLFYRFHSSVCFADIWYVAYVPLDEEIAAATSNLTISYPSHSSPPNGRSPYYDNALLASDVNHSVISSTIPRVTVTSPSPPEVRHVM